ncbi:hypothetical protein CK203_037628 [Vitis vinifera]|uniref:Reverse transcriptase Ty1/copia-type domain-containing protein n=1 Tax=Vitis vinifera TaxID=29760 RepID=A0A438HKN8_VITVI|nr:hypothetical protein CK203_037628 [Vitis vinifera]
MHSEFEMSMMGELNFFFGLQIKQLKEGTFINQAKYIRDLFKRFNMEEAKTMKTPMSSSIKLEKDEKGERQLPPGLRASALLSHLSLSRRRLAKRRVVTIFEPIFPTLVRAFYSRVTYGLGGPVMSTIRGVDIRLSL